MRKEDREKMKREMTQQMEAIWEDHHNQELINIKLSKLKMEKKKKDREEELGL
jgi:hypothetical protein